MLQCLSVKSPSSSLPTSPENHRNSDHPRSQGPSADGTPPRSSSCPEPINLLHEYKLSLYTNSYNEAWTRLRAIGPESHHSEICIDHQDSIEEVRERVVPQILHPNKESLQEALIRSRSGKLNRLVLAYFDESETTTALFLLLQKGVDRAKEAYTPLLELLSVLPHEEGSLSPSQCLRASQIFEEFESKDDLFPCPALNGFSQMRLRFKELKHYLDSRVKKYQSRGNLLKRASSGPALCLIGTSVVAAVAVAAVATHFLLAAVAAAPCAANYVTTPRSFAKRELYRAASLNRVVKFTYGLDRHLETIERLVDKLQSRIEDDRARSRMGIGVGGDSYRIYQVVKNLRNNPSDLREQLDQLEVQICLCFSTVNKARGLLLEQCVPGKYGELDSG